MKKFISIISLISTCAFAQEYQLTAILSGTMPISVNLPNNASVGSLELNFGTLTENVYVNAAAQTVRQVGNFSVIPSTTTMQFQIQQFPNLIGNITLNFASIGNFYFDTGAQPVTWDGSAFQLDSTIGSSTSEITGNYQITVGNQTSTGTFDYYMQASSYPHMALFTTMTTANYPSQIQMGNFSPDNFAEWYSSPTDIINTTVNGLQVQLSSGIEYNVYQGPVYTGSITACAVPEPTSAAISLCALGLLVFKRCVTRKNLKFQ